ncbi:decapping enzyme complex catalytic subunit DCP2 [Aspergillus aculeatinus CBS 121060]|uniref:DCP2-domain-containing protein n=1 Tax=Aspergillus aculeatinus CBS 121060 TaxID=1448322 RepID=A0ACD1HA74_9EURO|nr:DCP2-domain-containing protein [Aspergillus aculeatinus CBS 121060]RAH70299.1 DCP2-domain-containing protein [Aspergillus aculeatinus CBS 121060]
MTETKMQLEDWLDDLCVRFIINLPREELESVERICFQVEEAQWFYEDFIRPLDPALPSLSLKAFALRIFQHCPLMSQWSHYHHITAFSEFLAYKTRVPVRGAIMLNQDMDEVVLVKGWKKGANWSFPRGKINKGEKDIDCAIREVYEETGYDIREAGLVPEEKDAKYIEITMREQHMRLYVFRGVPQDAHFEPRTRKEISKIEWYKLSELPTLKKSKQQEQGLVVANANKFYMVAPFMHPLKKWIAQQKKAEIKSHPGARHLVQTEGELSMDEAPQAVNGFTPSQLPAQLATPSDLPELASSHDASSNLKRLLNINGLAPVQDNPANVATPADNRTITSKSNALLELLRSGSSQDTLPHAPGPDKALPPLAIPDGLPPMGPPYPDTASFPGFPQQAQHLRGPVPMNPVQFPQTPVSRAPVSNIGVPPLARPAHVGHAGAPPGHHGMPPLFEQMLSNPPRYDPVQASLPTATQPGPAPYQRTGDPQFSHSAQAPNIQGATVPPASKLPPPKLTTHSLALLNVFKDDSRRTPKTANASLVPPAEKVAHHDRRPSQHQDQLLGLLRGSSVPPTPGPAELPAQSVSPPRKQILQRPRGEHSPARHPAAHRRVPSATKDLRESSAVPSPLSGMPQSMASSKPSPKRGVNGSNRRNKKLEQAQMLASPVTILPRPQSAKKEPGSLPASSQSSRAPSRNRAAKLGTPEPAKPFQPQILRRSDNPNIVDLLPLKAQVNEQDQQQAGTQPAIPRRESQPQVNFDRRPSQTPAQREALLSLFGKAPASPGVSPAELSTSAPKTAGASGVVSPLTPLNITAASPFGSGADDGQFSLSSRVASPDNKAFLLGFLEGVAKGKK